MIYLFIITIAAFMKAIADILASQNEVNIFKNLKSTYFRPTAISWKRKWLFKSKFLRLVFSTIFVAFTDAWHSATLVMFLALFGLLFLPAISVLEIIILIGLFFTTFEGFYRILKTTNGFNNTDWLVLSAFLFLLGAAGLNNHLFDADLAWQIFIITGGLSILSAFIYGVVHLFINENK